MARLAEQDILLQLSDLSSKTTGLFWVAYSGGLDSQVLLNIARKAISPSQLQAIHINHGLSPQAETWQEHCRLYCEHLNIEFQCRKVEIDNSDSNLELQARQARYAVFESLIQENDYILMAHHQDDQMETILYRLLRGSGPKGLAGIPAQRKIGNGALLRPLLKYSKEALIEYADQSGLNWIEDESNKDINFDRNFLRQNIIPSIKSRWPSAGKSMQRSAELLFESERLLQDLAKIDVGEFIEEKKPSLPIDIMKGEDNSRQRNLLRYWFQDLAELYDIPMPGFEELRRIVEEVIPAAEDAQPLIFWKHAGTDMQLRRFAGKLYVLKDFPAKIDKTPQSIIPGENLDLGANLGCIKLEAVTSEGVIFKEGDELEIRFDSSQTEAKPVGRKTRTFKKLYQDYGVPSWLRDRIPLLYINGELAAVADLFICHEKAAKKGQKQLSISWQRADIHCGY